jgi:hypothetical protein
VIVYRRHPTSHFVILIHNATVPFGKKAGSIGLRDVKISGDQVSLHFQKPQKIYNLTSKTAWCVWHFSEAILWQLSKIHTAIWAFIGFDLLRSNILIYTFYLAAIFSMSSCWDFDSNPVLYGQRKLKRTYQTVACVMWYFADPIPAFIPMLWCRKLGQKQRRAHVLGNFWYYLYGFDRLILFLIINWEKYSKLLPFEIWMPFIWFAWVDSLFLINQLRQTHEIILFGICYTGRSINSGHRPNEEEEAKFVKWDDFV